jgi:hypothetical protein
MHKLLQKTFTLTAIASLLGLSYINPSQARSATDFDQCLKELTLSGLSSNQSAQACSKAFRPKELAYCIQRVKFSTEVNPDKILENCTKVRRPVELAKCVEDIRKKTENTDPNSVISYCGRSLLPQRFAECVIGVNSQGNVPVNEALDMCIKTKDS